MQKVLRKSVTVIAFALWCGCDAPALVGAGGDCVSLSECQLGLTCVEGRCSDDLSSLAGETPSFEDATVVMDAGPDAAPSDAGPGVDATPPAPDAGTPRDASVPRMDSSVPQPDASVPDASVPDAAQPRDADVADTAPPEPDATAVEDAEAPDAT